jgi:RNA polymerase sigma factor for flagellar operon FliA
MNSAAEYKSIMDESERNEALLEQLPQVRYIARHIHDRLPQHVALEDLVHAGVIGLIDAMNKFDSTKNVQFKTYAKFRIRGAILDSLRELDWSPRDLRRKARQLEEVTRRLGAELGRAASEQEIADSLDLPLAEFQRMLGELDGLDIGSLQMESTGEGIGDDLCEYLPGDPEESPYCLCLKSEMKELLASAISELPEREQQVLSLYYYEELTMKEVGAVLGVGESRVSQIHSMAVLRLRTKVQEAMRVRSVPPNLFPADLEGLAWTRY